MTNLKSVTFHGHIFEYEIDDSNYLMIKDGTTSIGVGQMRPLKPTDNIENEIIEMLKVYLPIKPIRKSF
jgi:hypothetical protein